jgi:hypothetical protein
MPFIDESTLERIAESARQARAEVLGFGANTIRKTADVLEVGGTAGVLGFVNARFGQGGQMSLLGVPIDLVAALTGLGAAWFGWAGDYDRDAEMIGAGALASYLNRLGAGYGASMKAQTGLQEITAGDSPALLGAHAGQRQAIHGGKQYVVSEMG